MGGLTFMRFFLLFLSFFAKICYVSFGGRNMAKISQQLKRNLTNEKKRLLNAAFKSSVKSAVKSVEKATEAKDVPNAEAALIVAFTKLDKAVSKGFLHKNNASRNKSRLQKLVNAIK